MKVALAFPGQGTQYIGMCKHLLQNHKEAQEVFEEACYALDFDITSLIMNGNLKELTLSENAQPAVITASYALYRIFKKEVNIQPVAAAGHSLGEISALIALGAMSFTDGIRYGRRRGKIMHQVIDQDLGRAAVVTDVNITQLEAMLSVIRDGDYAAISCYNSGNQVIVAGSNLAIKKLEDDVHRLGGEVIPFRLIPMRADAPYHSKLMKEYQPILWEAFQGITLNKPTIDLWSTVTGKKVQSTKEIKENIHQQFVSPVLWTQVIDQMEKSGIDVIIDIGPQQIMRNFMQETDTKITTYAFDDVDDRGKLFTLLKRKQDRVMSKNE